jgi:hypothetical protein
MQVCHERADSEWAGSDVFQLRPAYAISAHIPLSPSVEMLRSHSSQKNCMVALYKIPFAKLGNSDNRFMNCRLHFLNEPEISLLQVGDLRERVSEKKLQSRNAQMIEQEDHRSYKDLLRQQV